MIYTDYATKHSIEEIENFEDFVKYFITLEVPLDYGWYDDVNFIVKSENNLYTFPLRHKENNDVNAIFTGEVLLETKALYYYYFNCKIYGNMKVIINNKVRDIDNLSIDDMGKLSVNFSVPKWAKRKTMYHIFVDRYRRCSTKKMEEMPNRIIHKSFLEKMIIGPDENGIWNNDFYGGDLKGIENSLDYIYSLGASIIYLSPIVRSQSNHRYDTADYLNVDPYVGCNADLKSLCEAAHKKGMKVILDAVFNHTGNDSVYFNEFGTFENLGAFQSVNSKYSNFYRKHLENGKMDFEYWWGMRNLPVCDGNSIEWKKFITGEGGVIDKWFSLGIDGLRLDVADELSDEFIELIRKAVKRNKEDGFILGEVWKNPMRMGRGYIESGKGMDSVMNYLLVDALIRYFKYNDIEKLAKTIKEIKNEYPIDTRNALMNFTSTHDISRLLNILSSNCFFKDSEWVWNLINNDLDWQKDFVLSKDEYQKGRDIYEAYCFALNLMPGIFSIFYGDEIGLQGMGNLANRKPFNWNYMDKKLLRFFRNIGKIRRIESFLEEADFNILDINSDYLMFERATNEEKLLVGVNKTDKDVDILIPHEYKNYSKVYTLKKSDIDYLGPFGAIAIKK